MAVDRVEENHITNSSAYTRPQDWSGTMTTKELRETLLFTEGELSACGHVWLIVSKRIGPGVYKVRLVKKYPNT